ncbi:MAG: hypothetical protein AB7E39_06805 [Endomicrobiaceae bacterium]
MKKIILLCLALFCLTACDKAADVVMPDIKIVELVSISPYNELDINTEYNLYAKVTNYGTQTNDTIVWTETQGYCEFYNPVTNTWASTGTSISGSYVRMRCPVSARAHDQFFIVETNFLSGFTFCWRA